ncbi:MAG TPA: glycyl-radical enzyme activating protein [Bacteroidales bacterium]|nr:glycyl-radical enzyme activating protein [Bacteroidales bacterium]HQG37206.1 glycyl-radical enzyme activating protein [Bacteroidales bacterium]HQG53254.1 glycyl-radical enzyme activating protein [Bacteroidales bacterium]HQJ21368.1 glycyl-radical enzyme activating protein [Bacteroidales bacterium]HRC89301.1 glycyl-radical enzyme activating protein [Bacteroidales bacterium]
MKGLIFSVKKYTVHDGPGIRVTFFMKGCPLSCRWCHNPEGLRSEPEKVVQINKIGEKEFSKKKTVGIYYSVEDVITILDRERVFIDKSGGGVTFSGGEPMMQPAFLQEALEACRAYGFHTSVDTCGYFPSENLENIIPYTNLFLFDIKHLDPEKHIKYTGVKNELILKNLEIILQSGTDINLRIPVISGINDDDEYIQELKDYISTIKTNNIKMINLLPYHRTGVDKNKRLNLSRNMEVFSEPSQARMAEIADILSATGIKVRTGG